MKWLNLKTRTVSFCFRFTKLNFYVKMQRCSIEANITETPDWCFLNIENFSPCKFALVPVISLMKMQSRKNNAVPLNESRVPRPCLTPYV